MALSFPTTPYVGQEYSFGSRAWTWTGRTWKQTSATIGYAGSKGESSYTYSDIPPPTPLPGDRWFDTTIGVEFVWTYDGNSSQWIEIAGSGFAGQQGIAGYVGSQGIAGEFAGMGYTGSASPGYVGSRGAGFTGSSGVANLSKNIISSIIWGA